MNKEIITDFKQFISAMILQQANDLRDDIQRLDKKIDNIDAKLSKKHIQNDRP